MLTGMAIASLAAILVDIPKLILEKLQISILTTFNWCVGGKA